MQPTALHSPSRVVTAGHCRTKPIRTPDSEFPASVGVLRGGTFLTQCPLLSCSLQILRIGGAAPCISWSWPTHSSAFTSVSTLHWPLQQRHRNQIYHVPTERTCPQRWPCRCLSHLSQLFEALGPSLVWLGSCCLNEPSPRILQNLPMVAHFLHCLSNWLHRLN